jgi:hypothetical protein
MDRIIEIERIGAGSFSPQMTQIIIEEKPVSEVPCWIIPRASIASGCHNGYPVVNQIERQN